MKVLALSAALALSVTMYPHAKLLPNQTRCCTSTYGVSIEGRRAIIHYQHPHNADSLWIEWAKP